MPVSGGMLLMGFPAGIFHPGNFLRHGRVLLRIISEFGARLGPGILLQRGTRHRRRLPGIDRRVEHHISLARSIGAMTVGAYALVVIAAWALPETRGRVLATSPAGAADAGATP
jgi:hypothetical protein